MLKSSLQALGKPPVFVRLLQKGQAAYERFVKAWDDADPELQDRVKNARQRLKSAGEKTVAK